MFQVEDTDTDFLDSSNWETCLTFDRRRWDASVVLFVPEMIVLFQCKFLKYLCYSLLVF